MCIAAIDKYCTRRWVHVPAQRINAIGTGACELEYSRVALTNAIQFIISKCHRCNVPRVVHVTFPESSAVGPSTEPARLPIAWHMVDFQFGNLCRCRKAIVEGNPVVQVVVFVINPGVRTHINAAISVRIGYKAILADVGEVSIDARPRSSSIVGHVDHVISDQVHAVVTLRGGFDVCDVPSRWKRARKVRPCRRRA